ncbi:hypothetical protein WJX72_002803 [[Myrmecia] bisecta]|uniref:Uncharacterized protein n=1 Tax=[Myrmecia] bisecta TaxID=41462 RepID=A0AAW1R5Z9_9CHLO
MSGGGRGRGWYYKQKYGGGRAGGRGGRGGGQQEYQEEQQPFQQQPSGSTYHGSSSAGGGTSSQLADVLRRIDGKGYGAFKDIQGQWAFSNFSLIVDHVQSDPFAQPSRCRVQVPPEVAQIPAELYRTSTRKTALCDYITRKFGAVVAAAGGDVRTQAGGWQGEKGGEFTVDLPGQQVLERTSILISKEGTLEARFSIALPARGRTVLGEWAANILIQNLPRYVHQGLLYAQQDVAAIQRHVACVEDTEALRQALPGLGLVAFVGNGAILPRASGASDGPMPASEAIPFESPESLAVEVRLPNRGLVRGLGIKAGVSLIVGGGFHGKTTLLKAIEAGVYNKVPGDGRELVATDPTAVKVRAEDGRRVEAVNISPFISNLPYGRPTTEFRSDDASGSTSQAANIQEALEVGSTTLLVDEDTCATNFMIRDARMQALVAKDKEPITPFISKIRALAGRGVSCILVIGGSGDYFEVADTVVCMEAYKARDVTKEAHDIVKRFGAVPAAASSAEYGPVTQRMPLRLTGQDSGRGLKVSTRSKALISFGEEDIDLTAVEQLVEKSQTRAVADALQLIQARLGTQWRGKALSTIVAALDAEIDSQGLDALAPRMKFGNFARPRRFEIAAAVNRLRSLQMQQLTRSDP